MKCQWNIINVFYLSYLLYVVVYLLLIKRKSLPLPFAHPCIIIILLFYMQKYSERVIKEKKREKKNYRVK